ncbi:relaxase domain-containing protein [Micromonospora sp. MED01]|uniref:MobF family relaxase n=1 Tax=Micromonospora alfalfae TaxID=2911212 RepID=UPI001EE7B0F5|nr:MobF family relaxase [Micromonospora alfalfae]MCG5466723.1 relaxase domain-containing protein [Micromonospora alfalfae]
MLSVTRISPGDGYRYVMEQVAAGRHDLRPLGDGGPTPYYINHTARGESPGWWAGDGAAVLGVAGWVNERQMRYLIGQGRHPNAGYRLGQKWRIYTPMTDEYREKAVQRALAHLPADATVEQRDKVWHDIMHAPERRAVSAYDVTVSPVKSVSLLWAFGDDAVKHDVVAAHHAGVRSLLDHLQRHGAFARAGAGGVRQLDTAGLAALVFDHRMSRERDPQLHSHVVVSSKVQTVTADGDPQWLALDGKAFYRATTAGRVAYERAVEVELHHRLGVSFAAARDESGIREIVGLSDASLRHYGKRRGAITEEMNRRTDKQAPATRSVAAQWRRRAQDATLRTRQPHKGAESTHQAVQRWQAEDRVARLDTARQVRLVLDGAARDDTAATASRILRRASRLHPHGVDEAALRTVAAQLGVPATDHDRVIDAAVRTDVRLALARAVRDLGRERAVFGREHLELAIGRALDITPGESPQADWQRVQNLAGKAMTEGLAGLRVLTPPALVQWGPSLLRGSDRHSEYTRHRDLQMTTHTVLAAEKEVLTYAGRHGAIPAPAAAITSATAALRLSPEQETALRWLVSDDRRVTGVVGPAGTGKTYLQRAVVAAARETGVPVLGLTVGQSAAQLLADATAAPGQVLRTENIARWLHAQHRPPPGTTAAEWQFRPWQWVIIDEASQVSSHDLARLVTHLDKVNGKLILVGDPEQISAIGPGGLFRYLDSLGTTIHLSQVRRFTQPWEGAASLRLRGGDLTVLAEYDRRGRLIGGHRQHLIGQMLDRWAADMTTEHRSMILVETADEAADIARRARDILIHAGLVRAGPAVRLRDGNLASVGDIIVTRRNDRRISAGSTYVANRDQWRVDAIAGTGQVQVTNLRTTATAVLPAAYAAQHVQLAYALTVDSVQGQTVHTARALVDDNTSLARLYVMLTRGTTLNEAYVVTNDVRREGTPPQPPTARVAVLADIMRRATPDRSATETEQQLWADVDALHAWTPIYDDLSARARIPQYLAIVRQISGRQLADRLAQDLALPALIARLTTLREAGHDPTDVLRRAIRPREIDSADDIAAVLSWRIGRIIGRATADPTIATTPDLAGTYTERMPADLTGDIGDALRQVAGICDRRVRALADLAAEEQPAWARALGDVPDDPAGRDQWLARAEVVATYRDRYQLTSDHPIGAEPSTSDIARWNAWHRARVVVGAATLAGHLTTTDDQELTRLITAQHAADDAAPPYVADQLRDAHLRLTDVEQRHHDLALLLAAVDAAGQRATAHVQQLRPRWWQRGPSRTRILAAQRESHQRVDAATGRAAGLRGNLTRLREVIDQRQARVTDLESRHRTWSHWYTSALPTRYAGLAAAAEQARRTTTRRTNLADAVATTTARVRAIDETRPQPHATPITESLPQHATAARERTKTRDLGTIEEAEID